MVDQYDAAFFAQYDALMQETASLAHTDAALKSTQHTLGAVSNAERGAEEQRVANQKKQSQRRRRIERCENHWFYGTTALQPQTWLSGGIPAKVVKQKVKLAGDEAAAPGLASLEQQLEIQIGSLKQQEAALQGAVAHRRALEKQAVGMFEGAVASAPTAQLNSLGASANQWASALAAEQSIAAVLAEVARSCSAARQQYYAAISSLKQADRTNHSAQFNNVLDGSEFVEHLQQDQRDQMMHRAQGQAAQAANTLTQALARIPPTAPARYPHLASGLGRVSLHMLEQTGAGTHMLEMFGGDFGDAIAGQHASGMIHRNISILAQCEALASQQEGMVNALLQAVRQAAASAGATLQQIEASIATEKRSIFQSMRQGCGCAAVAGAAVLSAIPEGAPVFGCDPRHHLAAGTMQAAWHARKQGTGAPPATAYPAFASAYALPVGASPEGAAAIPVAQAYPTAAPAQPGKAMAQVGQVGPVAPVMAMATAVPAVPAAPAMTQMQVEVLSGACGGHQITVQTPAGLMQVAVPDGMVAGQSFRVVVPAAAPAVAQAVAYAVADRAGCLGVGGGTHALPN